MACFCTGACKGDPDNCPNVNPNAKRSSIRSSIEEILARDTEEEKKRWLEFAKTIQERTDRK